MPTVPNSTPLAVPTIMKKDAVYRRVQRNETSTPREVLIFTIYFYRLKHSVLVLLRHSRLINMQIVNT